MHKHDFRVLLIAASFEATRFGQQYVHDILRFSFRYIVHMNQSHDLDAEPGSVLYPEDEGKVLPIDTEEGVIDLLFRDGRCPEWIDVSVHAANPSFTVLRLLCCGRFTDERQRLYYEAGGFGPFGIKSPDLKFGMKDGDKIKLKNA